jgi:hypothetical protein
LLFVFDGNWQKAKVIWITHQTEKSRKPQHVLKPTRIEHYLSFLSSFPPLRHKKQFFRVRFVCLIIRRHHLRVVPFHFFLLGPCF